MAQVTTGIRALLSQPWVYASFQNAVGAKKERKELALRYMQVPAGGAVLDVGCGTADLADFLPGVRYVGFDPSEQYIDRARARLGSRAELFVSGIDDIDPGALDTFDVVVAQGVLHHIDDEQAAKVFEVAKKVVKPGGRVVTIDPGLVAGQSRIARELITRDRGQNVRTEDGYRALAEGAFDKVESFVRHDLLRIPYTHVVLICPT